MNLRYAVHAISVLLLIVIGFIFILPLLLKTKEEFDTLKKYIYGSGIPVYTGVVSLTASILMLFFPMKEIIILGDLIPMLVLLTMSITLLFGYIRQSRYISEEMRTRGESILTSLQVPIGIISIVSGVIHIFFPEIIFL